MKLRNKSGACNVKMMSAEGIESTTRDEQWIGPLRPRDGRFGPKGCEARVRRPPLLEADNNQMSHRRIPVYAFNLRSKCNDS